MEAVEKGCELCKRLNAALAKKSMDEDLEGGIKYKWLMMDITSTRNPIRLHFEQGVPRSAQREASSRWREIYKITAQSSRSAIVKIVNMIRS